MVEAVREVGRLEMQAVAQEAKRLEQEVMQDADQVARLLVVEVLKTHDHEEIVDVLSIKKTSSF